MTWQSHWVLASSFTEFDIHTRHYSIIFIENIGFLKTFLRDWFPLTGMGNVKRFIAHLAIVARRILQLHVASENAAMWMYLHPSEQVLKYLFQCRFKKGALRRFVSKILCRCLIKSKDKFPLPTAWNSRARIFKRAWTDRPQLIELEQHEESSFSPMIEPALASILVHHPLLYTEGRFLSPNIVQKYSHLIPALKWKLRFSLLDLIKI